MANCYKQLLAGLFLSWALGGVALADDALLQRARQFIDSGKPNDAFAILAPVEEQHAGEVEFDYLLGVSANASGQPGRAVFALERVLATSPDHTLARAEIAKSYYLLGEKKSARQEFQNVQRENPPDQVNQVINQYLSAIDKSLSERAKFSAFLEFAMGHDSNVNSATGSQQVAIPSFGGLIFDLNSAARKQNDNFTQFSGGVGFRNNVTTNLAVFGGVSATEHFNWKNEQFDTQTIDVNVGASLRHNRETFTATLQDNNFALNGENYRNAYGATGQWQHTIDNSNQISAFVQGSRLEYKTQPARSADRYLGGVGYGHAFSGSYLPVLFLSAYLGTEDERHRELPWMGQDFYGVRAGGQLTYNPRTVVYGSASYEHRDYGGTEPLWLVSRTDRQFDASVGVKYTPAMNWTIRPQFSYTLNDSNVTINDYNRYMLSVTFRRDFSW